MFTVIIAEKEYIEKTQEYQLFLKPFMNPKHVGLCQWNTEYTRFSDMVPSLTAMVGRRKEWRAIIICNEDGITKKNPFDLVSYVPERFEGPAVGELEGEQLGAYEEYLKGEHEKKLSAYEEAGKNPLTRLVTFFCEGPTVSKQSATLAEDPGYKRYIAEALKKQAIRQEIMGDEVSEIAMPSEVLCIAKRTYHNATDGLETIWSSHTELEYSRFYDRNLYFDKMRYLVFDILSKSQQDYAFDYVRFLYVTMLLASKKIPSGCLSANRVYNLDCENDEDAFRELLYTYEAKLDVTKEFLEQRIKDIKEKRPAKLTDKEAEQIFCAKVNVPVTLTSDFDTSELFVSSSGIGFANGCPSDEYGIWQNQYNKSKKALHGLLKQSHRSLRRAAINARGEDNVDIDKVGLLNEFQIDDVKEHINNEELAMIHTRTPDLYNEEAFLDKMEVEDKAVKDKTDKRMGRKTTIVVGFIGLFAYILGFFTLFYVNSSSDAFNLTISFLFMLCALGAIFLVAIVALIFLRRSLVKLFKRFNWVMRGIKNEVHGSMTQYSLYLSHMCNVRRGFSVLNAAETQEDPDGGRIILYRKHILDIEAAKAEVRDVFGHYMVEDFEVDLTKVTEYDFNFDRPTEYIYPLPFTEGKIRTIEFLQKGLQTEVPVEFVKSITVRREELYD